MPFILATASSRNQPNFRFECGKKQELQSLALAGTFYPEQVTSFELELWQKNVLFSLMFNNMVETNFGLEATCQ